MTRSARSTSEATRNTTASSGGRGVLNLGARNGIAGVFGLNAVRGWPITVDIGVIRYIPHENVAKKMLPSLLCTFKNWICMPARVRKCAPSWLVNAGRSLYSRRLC